MDGRESSLMKQYTVIKLVNTEDKSLQYIDGHHILRYIGRLTLITLHEGPCTKPFVSYPRVLYPNFLKQS